MDLNNSSDQLEEGEIVDDDLEDISDNSILETLGKFLPPNGDLRALNLSSDSDTLSKSPKRKRKCRHHRRPRQKRRKKRAVSDSCLSEALVISDTSSDSDTLTRQEIKDNLREALRLSEIQGRQKNDLETRLKRMGNLAKDPEPEPVKVDPPPEIDKSDDRELENLRLEALKTAFINKIQRRKRKDKNEEKPQNVDNKENENLPVIDKSDEKKACLKPNNTDKTPEIEEDEDLLRAALLAGLSKKITKISVPAPKIQPVVQKLVPLIKPIKKLVINNKKRPLIVPKPQVKPLIINLKESDTDDDSSPQKPPTKAATDISSKVHQFLKEQRQRFEQEKKTMEKDSILEKSAVKLLPKSQQVEYQQLLRRLKLAEKKSKLRKLQAKKVALMKKPERTPEDNSKATQTEVVDSGVPEVPKLTVDKGVEQKLKEIELDKKNPVVINELTVLKKALKDIRAQRSRSLQMKSKYQVLTPIIKKINEASTERKRHEQKIKTLLKQLNEARTNLSNSHQKFSESVKDLVEKKEVLDKSVEKAVRKEAKIVPPVTSTPLRVSSSNNSVEDCTVSTITNHECEDMDVCDSDEDIMAQIDIVDPNDIYQIFTRKPIKYNVPDYVSPLNFDRYEQVDPHGIMCPYEVNGSCRDADCTFKHYLKKY